MPKVNRAKGLLQATRNEKATTLAQAMILAQIRHSSLGKDRKVFDTWQGLECYTGVVWERYVLVRCIRWGVNVDAITIP